MKIAPSVLATDLADLKGVLPAIEEAGCNLVHFDVMDGHFVPNLTFGPPLVKACRSYCGLPFDVHLMVTNPADYIPLLTDLNINLLSFHIEATNFAPRLISLIREQEMRPSVALNPQTPLTFIEHVLPLVSNVLIMSVDPGFAGQKFIQTVYSKIKSLADYREANELTFSIQVDGGVNEGNITELAGIGVDIVVAGNAYFTAAEPTAFVNAVQSL